MVDNRQTNANDRQLSTDNRQITSNNRKYNTDLIKNEQTRISNRQIDHRQIQYGRHSEYNRQVSRQLDATAKNQTEHHSRTSKYGMSHCLSIRQCRFLTFYKIKCRSK